MRDLEPEKWIDKHPHEFLMSIIHYVREDAYRIHVFTEEIRKDPNIQDSKLESLDVTVGEMLQYIDDSTEKIMQVMVLASEYANSHGWEPGKD